MSELIVEVCKIESVERHDNADRLDIAQVKGWNCIVGREEFKAGDLCVYIPIDSILPDALEEKLFSGTKVKLKNHRVRTIKLRGVISQGLVIPVTKALGPNASHGEGSDVKDYLGITKWEPPVKAGPNHTKKHPHPDFKKYTNINHWRNYPRALEAGEPVTISEKIHGTNFRCGWLPYKPRTLFAKLKKSFWPFGKKWEFVFGSHNVQLQDDSTKQFYEDNVYARIVEKYNLKERLWPMRGTVLYGEIYGAGIQTGYSYGLDDIALAGIDVFSTALDGYLDQPIAEIYMESIGVKHAPVLYRGPYNWDAMDKNVFGPSVLCPEQKHREGVVVKPIKERNGHCGRVVLKYTNTDYLLLKDNSEWH